MLKMNLGTMGMKLTHRRRFWHRFKWWISLKRIRM